MRKILSVIAMLVISSSLFAQKDVTKFLGIPVDGSKAEMIRKLKEKGFVNHPYDKEILTGEFNGSQVLIGIDTNSNKVWRIRVIGEVSSSETNTKIRFNNLCQQFLDNPKYVGQDNQTIDDDEDISYELTVHDKRYQAVFYQMPSDPNVTEENFAKKLVWFKIAKNDRGNYCIVMFYENGYNEANGEDL